MLCLPLGGVSLYEVLATYLALIAVGGHLRHDQPGVQQLLPADGGVAGGFLPADPAAGALGRAVLAAVRRRRRGLPAVRHVHVSAGRRALAICAACCSPITSERLLHPPDVGSEGKDVVDRRSGAARGRGHGHPQRPVPRQAVRPAKRTDLLADGPNPVYDKEMRSELFSQGTLMLRLVIQVSMFLALPLMAVVPVHLARPGPLVHQLRACCSTCWSGRCSRPAASPASASGRRSICCWSPRSRPGRSCGAS